jgi:hypothetical protein
MDTMGNTPATDRPNTRREKMEARKRISKKRKRGKMALLVGSVVTGVLATVFLVASCGGGHGRFHRDPEKVRKFALWKVDDTLDDLDATESQKKQILAIADRVVRDFQALHDDKDQDHEKILAELERGRPNSQIFHDMLDQRTEQFNQLGHKTIDRFLTAWNVLDRSQQAELIEEIRDHVDDYH